MRSRHSTVATVFRALGDDTRLQILVLLGKREFCVCELVELFGLSQSAVSEHLRRLKDAGLAVDERRGMWVFYRLPDALPAFVTEALQAVDLEPEVVERLRGLRPTAAVCARAPQAQATVLGPVK
jgi:DNA-binding transcriptional ArsR family regulator